MTIGRICQREVSLADAAESVADAALRMRERKVGTLLVLDAEGRPVGILTDRDLAIRVVAEARDLRATRVEQVMSSRPRTVSEGTPIEDALALMCSAGVRRLPVVDAAGRLAGIVSLDDVLLLIAEEVRSMQGVIEKESPSGTLA